MDDSINPKLGWEGVFENDSIPLPMRRAGMAEWQFDHVLMLDRRRLPLEEVYLQLRCVEEVAQAIENMVIQGAFSISIAAGYGLALSAPQTTADDIEQIELAAQRLIQTRPTGLAIARMMKACIKVAKTAIQEGKPVQPEILSLVDQAATVLAKQGYETGKNACDLLADGSTILTQCFPDRSYVYLLLETARRGKTINVICSETRPYLQGARLTALCAQQAGFKTKVITDGMGGLLMRQGEVDAFVTAADRVCMDGTVCNKVGTYQYALAAQANGLPYYTLRQSGPDRESASEADIEVEYRNGEEIVNWAGVRTAPIGVHGYYPSFDITPPDLVTKIVTDRGVFDSNKIASYFETAEKIPGAIV